MFGTLMQWELTGKQLLKWILLGLCAVLKIKNFFQLNIAQISKWVYVKSGGQTTYVKRNLSVNNLWPVNF